MISKVMKRYCSVYDDYLFLQYQPPDHVIQCWHREEPLTVAGDITGGNNSTQT